MKLLHIGLQPERGWRLRLLVATSAAIGALEARDPALACVMKAYNAQHNDW